MGKTAILNKGMMAIRGSLINPSRDLLLKTNSFDLGSEISNDSTYGVSGIIRVEFILSRIVIVFQLVSTYSHLSSASSPRRAPVIKRD